MPKDKGEAKRKGLGVDKKQETAVDVTNTFEYPWHDPTEVITGYEGFLKVAMDLFGPNFDASIYKDYFFDIREAKTMGVTHHCTHNDPKGHARTRACVTDGHISYCLEWMTKDGRRVRCGKVYKMVSGGCGKHPTNVAPMNKLACGLADGTVSEATWAEFNDPERMEQYRAEQQEAADEKERKEKDEADMEEFIAAGRYKDAQAQPHLRFEQEKEVAMMKRKTESAEKAKTRQLVMEVLSSKYDKKNLEAIKAKNPAKYEKIYEEEDVKVKASLATKAAEAQVPPKDPRLVALDLKKSNAVELKNTKGKSKFLDRKKPDEDHRSFREMMGLKNKEKKRPKEDGNEENEPPVED